MSRLLRHLFYHFLFIVEKYSYLVDGTAAADIEKFISENSTFDEFVNVGFHVCFL